MTLILQTFLVALVTRAAIAEAGRVAQGAATAFRRPVRVLHTHFLLSVAAVAIATGAAAAPPSSTTPINTTGTLKVTAIPDEAPTELQRKFEPLGRYLEQRTGQHVQFIPVTDYPAVVEALATRLVDLAWLGGFTYIQAKHLTHGAVIPIVQRVEDSTFTSRFITSDPSIQTLADLKGKTFAFGSPSSTSGHLMPRYFLLQAGIDPDRDLRNIAFSGAHDATAAFVQSGKVSAGALNASVWDKLLEQKKVDPSRVRVFATTPPYFDYNWTVRADLDRALIAKLTEAFLALDPANSADKQILDLQRASKFIATRSENYAGIESAARAAGLLK